MKIVIAFIFLFMAPLVWGNAADEPYRLPLTIGNEQFISKDIGTDYTYSTIELSQYAFGLEQPWYTNLFEIYIGMYLSIINHEVIGHTYSGNDLGVTTEKYGWNFDSAATYYNSDDWYRMVNEDPTPTKVIAAQKNAILSLGGVQASSVLAYKMQRGYVSEDKTPRGAVRVSAYIFSLIDKWQYTSGVSGEAFTQVNRGYDPIGYAMDMADAYGVNASDVYSEMESVSQLDLVNPILFYSLFSDDVPMLPLGSIRWLPWLSGEYTPFGYGRYLNNFFKVGRKLFEVNLGSGTTYNEQKYSSVAFRSHNLIQFSKLDLGLILQTWKQPELFTEDPLNALIEHGGMVFITSEYFPKSRKDASVTFKAGYKTEGYVLEETVYEQVLVRVGIMVRF